MILPKNAQVNGSDRICLNSCDSENPLTKYLILTQTFPQGSREQKKAFERLCYHLKPHLRCKNSRYVSEQDHEEAVNDTLLVVYKYLNRLTPNHIVPFAKNVLSKKLVNQIRKPKKPTVSLDQSMSEDGQTPFSEMIAHPEPDPTIEEYERVKNLVEKDPENMLQKTMRGRPEITWHKILQYRLQGYQWKELAQIFGKTSISSLSSFDKREIKRLTPYLRESLSS